MSPEAVNVYKAINELQTVLVGLIDDARHESREDHLVLLKRLDDQDVRLRNLERKQEPTPWPPMQKSSMVITDATATPDERPVFKVTFGDFKRWGWAFGLLIGAYTAASLTVDGILKFFAWLGFHR